MARQQRMILSLQFEEDVNLFQDGEIGLAPLPQHLALRDLPLQILAREITHRAIPPRRATRSRDRTGPELPEAPAGPLRPLS